MAAPTRSELHKARPDPVSRDDPWLYSGEILEPPPRREPLPCPFSPLNASVLDGLVPLDLPNSISDLTEDQLESILPGVAQFILDGYGWIDWYLLHFESGVDEPTFILFRKKLFKTLAKFVLNVYDVHDFQARLDETNIIRSCRLFRDHLTKVYGTSAGDFSKAMVDIAELKIDFTEFPFLREEDICYTLETYQMDCFKVSRHNRSLYAKAWPYLLSRCKRRPCVVFERHLNLLREVLKEYIPLSESEKMDLLLEMDQEPLIFEKGGPSNQKREVQPYGPLMRALSLEPWIDIQPADLDVFHASKDSLFQRDTYFPHHIFSIIDVSVQLKAKQVHMLRKHSTFPLQCGFWGRFPEEVHEVFRIAHLKRRQLGERFLSARLIMLEILCTRIRRRANTFLLLYCELPTLCGRDFTDNYVVNYICRWAEYVSNKSGCGSIKLEHIFLAIVIGEGLADWYGTPKQGIVDEFLKQCDEDYARGSSGPKESSPDKKKMKLNEDAIDSILFETDPKIYEDHKRMLWDYMVHLCGELEKYGDLPRKKLHHLKKDDSCAR